MISSAIVAGVFIASVWGVALSPREEVPQAGLPTSHIITTPQHSQSQNEGDTGFEALSKTVLGPFAFFVYEHHEINPQPEYVPTPQADQQVSQGPQSLTDEEILNRLWPPVYREALQSLEIRMVEDGFITKREQHSVMQSDADIYAILSKLIDYAEKQGWIVTDDALKLRTGLAVDLPRQIEAERKALRIQGINTSQLLPRNQHIAKSDSKSLAIGIIDGLKYILSAHYADAQIPGVPGWHTTPDCYKDLAPFNPIPGFNSLAICCNCGLFCAPPLACVFVPDCGPFSVACTIPLGCLNLNCKLWPNAIWDKFTNPLGTGICGCG